MNHRILTLAAWLGASFAGAFPMIPCPQAVRGLQPGGFVFGNESWRNAKRHTNAPRYAACAIDNEIQNKTHGDCRGRTSRRTYSGSAWPVLCPLLPPPMGQPSQGMGGSALRMDEKRRRHHGQICRILQGRPANPSLAQLNIRAIIGHCHPFLSFAEIPYGDDHGR